MARQRDPQLTGIDVLIGMAEAAAQTGRPLARQFSGLLASAATPGTPITALEEVAKGPLREHETVPVRIIAAAASLAQERRDWETLYEVTSIGARATAVWPRYLMTTVGGHPEYGYRDSAAHTDADARQVVQSVLRDTGAAVNSDAFLGELSRRGFEVVPRP